MTESKSVLPCSIYIAGCARDIVEYLPRSLTNVYRIASLFASYEIGVFENDSVDGTRQLLEQYARADPRFHLLVESDLDRRLPLRTHRLAYGRNALLNRMAGHTDFYLAIDLDNIGSGDFNTDNFLRSVSLSGWDGMSFYPGRPYYDTWAFRDEICDRNLHNDPSVSGHDARVDSLLPASVRDRRASDKSGWNRKNGAVQAHIERRFQSLMAGEMTIRVDSAFAGVAIYRAAKTRGCRYDGRVTLEPVRATREEVEHVAFHRDMTRIHDAVLVAFASESRKPVLGWRTICAAIATLGWMTPPWSPSRTWSISPTAAGMFRRSSSSAGGR